MLIPALTALLAVLLLGLTAALVALLWITDGFGWSGDSEAERAE